MIYNFIIKNLAIIISILLTIILIIYIEIREYKYRKYGITPQDAIKIINNNNAVIFDFRDETVFKKCHIINSINIPYNKIDSHKNTLNKYKKHIIILIENKKNNHKLITATLNNYGYKNIMYMINGIDLWIKNNLPTYKKD